MTEIEEQKTQEAALAAHKRSLIFIKSTVIALFVVLVVLIIAFIVVKNKKEKSQLVNIDNCKELKTIIIENEVEELEIQGSQVNILTEFNEESQTQEFIKIDSNCGQELARFKLKIKNKNE